MDRVARVVISVGGLGVIGAVLIVLVYLGMKVWPLLRGGELTGLRSGSIALKGRVHEAVTDEYRGLALLVLRDGRIQPVDLQDFKALGPLSPTESGATVTAISTINDGHTLAFGRSDGTVQLGKIGFDSEFLQPEAIDRSTPEGKAMDRLVPGDRVGLADGYVERTPQNQYRRIRPAISFGAPVGLRDAAGIAVRRIDYRTSSSSQHLVAQLDDGRVVTNRVTITTPLGGGKPRTKLLAMDVRLSPSKGHSAIADWVFVSADGACIYLLWRDGHCQRYAVVADDTYTLMEERTLIESGRTVTSASLLLGGKTLLLGDDTGTVTAAFPALTPDAVTPDAWQLVIGHRLKMGTERLAAVTSATRDRTIAAANHQGSITLQHVTSEKVIAHERFGSLLAGEPVAIAISPKGDGLLVVSEQEGKASIVTADLRPGHPEVSTGSLFGKVWYEGDAQPAYTYQAATGEDTAETKYSQVPLLFGTIKSTIYSMLFATPLAILAAIYTSEFLHPRVRNRVKPVVEMMASLPSVVLGFLAALLIAPFVREYLPGVLMAFVVVPVSVLIAAHLWQLLPISVTTRLTSTQHIAMILLVVLVGAAAAVGAGRIVERALFKPSTQDQLVLAGSTLSVPREAWPVSLRGLRELSAADVLPFRAMGLYYSNGGIVKAAGSLDDPQTAEIVRTNSLDQPSIQAWLNGMIGTPEAGWMMCMIPVGIVLAAMVRSRWVDPLLRERFNVLIGIKAAAIELAKLGCTLLVGLLTAWLLAMLLTAIGLESRESIFGVFSQRNTLVVAIVMGFAIIPIIYTISEDALSAVPRTLRSASLGCGATRWQTAVSVVLPVAISGIFSAVMIGLGRAAGETMIVLMATGNTPNMDWSIFSGFRTLSANIATEMPEAAQHSSHERVLYVSALCLFLLTFAINSIAEVVRQRFRKRSAAL